MNAYLFMDKSESNQFFVLADDEEYAWKIILAFFGTSYTITNIQYLGMTDEAEARAFYLPIMNG